VTFAQTRVADQQYRFRQVQVVTLRQFQHLLAVELRQEGKVEIGQFFEQRKVGILDAALAAIAETPVHFLLNQGGQIGLIGPAGQCSRLRLRPVGLVQRRQLQLQ